MSLRKPLIILVDNTMKSVRQLKYTINMELVFVEYQAPYRDLNIFHMSTFDMPLSDINNATQYANIR